ncbi:MAG: PAS domain-containing protein [Parvibaculum sp.]|nr:PAS domain-containing protein [Parvibaculum sp.]
MDAWPQFQTDESLRFFNYWNGLPREGAVVPDRRHFDPLSIRDLTPMMVMVEYESLQSAQFRYAGSKLTEIMGFDPTRKNYLDLLKEEAFQSFFAASEPLIGYPCGGRFPIKVQAATGYVIQCEALDLPLYNERSANWIIMALMSIVEVVGIHDERDFRILEIGAGEWIDIGAGCPASGN